MEIGRIKTIENVDGELICQINFGADVTEPAIVYCSPNINEWPLPGDEVVVADINGQNTVIAAFKQTPSALKGGEVIVYSRGEDGDVSASVRLTDDGKVNVNDGDDSAALTSKVDLLFETLDGVFRTDWVIPPAPDAGAALKTAYLEAFPTPPQSVNSETLEVDK